mgnify:CR=1 FL=1
MGLFDKLLKGAVDAIDNAAAKNGNGPTGLKDLFDQAMDKKNEAINGTSSSTASSKPSTATSNTREAIVLIQDRHIPHRRKFLTQRAFLQSRQER